MWVTGLDYAAQVGVGHFYHIFYEGCLTNFEIGEGGEEAPELYPEVKYTRMDEYLKVYKHEKLCIWPYLSVILCLLNGL